MARLSYVSLVTNAEYCLGALVLAASLRQTNTVKEITVMVTKGVTEAYRRLLRDAFDNVIEVQEIENPDRSYVERFGRSELLITFTKIRCWSLVQFEKCVYLDADTIVLHNIDELFEREELTAVPDPCWPDCFNTGVFVFRPKIETYKELLKLANEVGSFDGGDQGLLNTYFSNWLSKGISHRLSYVYNCICQITDECGFDFYTSTAAWVHFGGTIRVAHFSGPVKPWHRVSAAKGCSLNACEALTKTKSERRGITRTAGMLAYWWSLFLILVRPKLSPDMVLGDFYIETKYARSNFPDQNLQQTNVQDSLKHETRVPNVHQSLDWATKSPYYRPPSPPRMVPYHPEFHETRWEYLHHGQRTDQENRFRQYHEVPKPVPKPASSFSHTYVPPNPPPKSSSLAPQRAASPTVKKSHPPAQESGFFFSPPPPSIPLPSTPVKPLALSPSSGESVTVSAQSRCEPGLGESVSETTGLTKEIVTSVWQPEPKSTSEPPPSYLLECQKCRCEMTNEKKTMLSVSRSRHTETGRAELHKRVKQKRKRAARAVVQKAGSKRIVDDTQGSVTCVGSVLHSQSPSRATKLQIPVLPTQASATNSELKLGNAIRGPEQQGDLPKQSNEAVCLEETTSLSHQKGKFVVQVPQKLHQFQALDLAITRQKADDNKGWKQKSQLEPYNLELPVPRRSGKAKLHAFSWDECVLHDESLSYTSPRQDVDIVPMAEIPLIENSIKSPVFTDLLSPEKELFSRPDELATGFSLYKSKRRTIKNLRKSREKLKERGFDREVARATWENKEEVEELCKLLSASGLQQPGISGQLATLNLGNKLCPRHEWIETERMYAWERGEIDYTGTDRFANILAKLCETMVKSGGEKNLPVGLDLS
ncbi:glycosyltransferase, family 8 [Opisthorchis viverrini]|uniref:glycogenin glucosyltransferase n=1 Tax=Opisthorchis viverrini TaxID=6198 RepID=A0A1S8X245_OPIVI|nr:glycosyltransferase, family 8 [Opisthorchis viverrini]